MKKYIYLLATIILGALMAQSCMKVKEDAIQDTEMITATVMIDINYELDFSSGIEQSAQNNSYHELIPPQSSNPPACATITVETAPGGGFPRTFTVDYGTGCNLNGFTRSGKLIITLSDYFMNPGCVMTVTRENYKANDWASEGTIVFTNESIDDESPTWSRSVNNMVFTNQLGIVYHSSGNRIVRQIGGFGNTDLEDNVYEISSGSQTLSKDNGQSLTIDILSPVVKLFSCDYISEGVMHIEGELLNGNIDYGDGNCDNKAVYTHNNGLTFKMNL